MEKKTNKPKKANKAEKTQEEKEIELMMKTTMEFSKVLSELMKVVFNAPWPVRLKYLFTGRF